MYSCIVVIQGEDNGESGVREPNALYSVFAGEGQKGGEGNF